MTHSNYTAIGSDSTTTSSILIMSANNSNLHRTDTEQIQEETNTDANEQTVQIRTDVDETMLSASSNSFPNSNEVRLALENLFIAAREAEALTSGLAKMHCILIRIDASNHEGLHPIYSSILSYSWASTNPCASIDYSSLIDVFSIAREDKRRYGGVLPTNPSQNIATELNGTNGSLTVPFPDWSHVHHP